MFDVIAGQLVIFMAHLILFLLLTLTIATLTLLERKLMSLVQRRVGPNYIGYRGRLQFLADAFKLLVKHIYIVNRTRRLLFFLVPCAVLVLSYTLWSNLIWGPSIAICEVEYNLLFMSILSLTSSILIFLVSISSQNKYAILASARVVVITLTLEIFLTFFIIFCVALYESFSFFQAVNLQTVTNCGVFFLLPSLPVLLVIFFLETGRIPFDLSEAESELIAGYTVEMGGFFFALFYLGEYFHLYCFSVVYALCLLGGWN